MFGGWHWPSREPFKYWCRSVKVSRSHCTAKLPAWHWRGISLALLGWVGGDLALGGKAVSPFKGIGKIFVGNIQQSERKTLHNACHEYTFLDLDGWRGLWMDYITVSSPHLLHHIYATPHMLHKAQMVVSSVLLSHFLFGMKHVFNCIFLYTVYRLLISIWLPFPISPGFVKKPKLCQHSAVCNQCNQTDLVLVSV